MTTLARVLLGAALVGALLPAPVAAAEPLSWIVNGPAADGRVSARVALDADGRLSFGVDYQVEPYSRLPPRESTRLRRI